MATLSMKKKNTKNKQKFVTKNTYTLMFGNEAPSNSKTGKKYFQARVGSSLINGKVVITK